MATTPHSSRNLSESSICTHVATDAFVRPAGQSPAASTSVLGDDLRIHPQVALQCVFVRVAQLSDARRNHLLFAHRNFDPIRPRLAQHVGADSILLRYLLDSRQAS